MMSPGTSDSAHLKPSWLPQSCTSCSLPSSVAQTQALAHTLESTCPSLRPVYHQALAPCPLVCSPTPTGLATPLSWTPDPDPQCPSPSLLTSCLSTFSNQSHHLQICASSGLRLNAGCSAFPTTTPNLVSALVSLVEPLPGCSMPPPAATMTGSWRGLDRNLTRTWLRGSCSGC